MELDLNKSLTKTLLDIIICLENVKNEDIDDDFIIQLLEQISYNLNLLSSSDKNTFINIIRDLSNSYVEEEKNLVLSLPYALGIIDEI